MKSTLITSSTRIKQMKDGQKFPGVDIFMIAPMEQIFSCVDVCVCVCVKVLKCSRSNGQ